MNVLVVHAHPAPDSFVSHLRDVVLRSLTGSGHTVDLADLYVDGFAPCEPFDTATDERTADRLPPDPLLDSYRARLADARALVLVHPTWWGGHPAILTGWLEGVLGDGARAHASGGGSLRHLRRLAVVTTHGSPRWVNRAQGEPGRRAVLWSLRSRLGPTATRPGWLACYGLDRIDGEARARFVRRVERHLSGW